MLSRRRHLRKTALQIRIAKTDFKALINEIASGYIRASNSGNQNLIPPFNCMEQFWSEFTHENLISLPVVLARMILATFLGAIIGLEREWRRRPAGLKTHMMVCLASATFTIVSLELVNVPIFEDQNIQMDPSRLVEAITSGVAFLAAGFIIFAKGKITGITTGAGMWLAAAIGLASGLGLWHIAIIATVIAVAMLIFVGKLEQKVSPDKEENTSS